MNYGKIILNKVINEDNLTSLKRYNIEESDFTNDIDKETYKLINEYAQVNNGKVPSYATVASEVDGFEHIPDISDSFYWLATKIKSNTAKNEVMKWFESGKFEKHLQDMDGRDFVKDFLPSLVEDVSKKVHINEKVGTDITEDTSKFTEEYERRKAGESFKIWKSKYSSIGEYISGNIYTVIGESGRGKSVLSLEDAVYMAQQGANVLIYSLEMGWYETMVRIYTSISGDMGVARATFDGIDMDVGFNSRDIRIGGLKEDNEDKFMTFLSELNRNIKGSITLRAVDDEDFIERGLKQLESDIMATDADVVMIDPFYYLEFENNTSRTAGGDASATSRKLRAITGRLGVVTIAITQAEVQKEEIAEDGVRELVVPSRKDVKTTKSLLEDASVLIGIDSNYKQGYAIVANLKGRDGGEGDVSNVIYIPQMGLIDEIAVGEDAVDEFNF